MAQQSDQEFILASEVPFLFGSRKADIVKITKDELTVYEIKSVNDSTLRLKDQIKDYQTFFEKCYVVCETGNLLKIRKTIPKSVGIILISKNKITQTRKSKARRKLNKLALASVFPNSYLKKLISRNNKKTQVELAKNLTHTFTLQQLKLLVKDFLWKKYSHGFLVLKSEYRGAPTDDDIYIISKNFPTSLQTKSTNSIK